MINQVFEHGDCIYYANDIYCKMDPAGVLVKDCTSFLLFSFVLFGLVVVGFILGKQ